MPRIKTLPANKRSGVAGMTLIELIMTCGILLILSAAAILMFRITIQHRKEAELRYDLRQMRNAIDRYKDDADKNLIRTEVGSQNYPADLQPLVDGVAVGSGGNGPGDISASALAGSSNTGQFGSAGTPGTSGTPQFGVGQGGAGTQFGPGATGGGIPSLGSTGPAGQGGLNTPTKVRY